MDAEHQLAQPRDMQSPEDVGDTNYVVRMRVSTWPKIRAGAPWSGSDTTGFSSWPKEVAVQFKRWLDEK